jgi:CubicO group peptidase (beta-lactamase class C family)
MKFNRITVICLFIFIIAAVKSQPANSYNFSPLNQLVNKWVERNYYQGASLIIAKNDTIVFEKYYGNYTPQTEVYIASAGKWLAAATIAVVVDRTELTWDDSVEKWLPEFKGDPKGKIKLKQLLYISGDIVTNWLAKVKTPWMQC